MKTAVNITVYVLAIIILPLAALIAGAEFVLRITAIGLARTGAWLCDMGIASVDWAECKTK